MSPPAPPVDFLVSFYGPRAAWSEKPALGSQAQFLFHSEAEGAEVSMAVENIDPFLALKEIHHQVSEGGCGGLEEHFENVVRDQDAEKQ